MREHNRDKERLEHILDAIGVIAFKAQIERYYTELG